MSMQLTWSALLTLNYGLSTQYAITCLFMQATKTLASAFVLSRLDYCNSLLSGCPQYLVNRLQKVQNNAARFVVKAPKTDHITPHLCRLHWLPIDAKIKYNISSLCFDGYVSDLNTEKKRQTDTNLSCAPGGVRTSGLWISSPTLNQLSHPRQCCCC